MNIWQKIENSSLANKHTSIFEFAKFCVVGVSGTIIDFGVFSLLTRLVGIYYIYATAVSVFLAIINNFLLNKFWTFRKGRTGKTKSESIKFFIVSIANYLLNIGITYGIVEYSTAETIFGQNEDFFAKAIAIGVVLVSNYLGNKYWTFRG